jgi:hypothetical protein
VDLLSRTSRPDASLEHHPPSSDLPGP